MRRGPLLALALPLALVLAAGCGVPRPRVPALSALRGAVLGGTPSPTAAPAGHLVITAWAPAAAASAGPRPGYSPRPTELGDHVRAARAARTSSGVWVIQIDFDAVGASELATLTSQAAGACPQSDCAERHLTFWLGLTVADLAAWGERSGTLYRSPAAGGKLLADPVVVQPIGSGHVQISGNYTQSSAEYIARRIGAAGAG